MKNVQEVTQFVQITKYVLYAIILSLSILFSYQIYRIYNLRKRFGKTNYKRLFLKGLKIKFFIPNKKSDSYKNTADSLLNNGWDISVEGFYICKYVLAFTVLVFGALITSTNTDMSINQIYNDFNLGRSSLDEPFIANEEVIIQEASLMEEVNTYLANIKLEADNTVATGLVQAYLESKGISYYESTEIISKRILLKLTKLEKIAEDYTRYIQIICYAIIAFLVPDMLLLIKSLLIEGKKDWEAMHCMIAYTIIASLPPYKVSAVIEEMQGVAPIYFNALEDFKNAVLKNDDKALIKIYEAIDNEDMQELLETLTLGIEKGVQDTVDIVDDQLDTKVEYIKIYAEQRRALKTTIALIPVMITTLHLFNYLMYGINMVSQRLLIVM
jgi:hypothetical protein